MHKYAARTALAITLNITMLALAVSASLTPANARGGFIPTNEEQCDYWGARWGIGCHCRFECRRKYSYVVKMPCRFLASGWVETSDGFRYRYRSTHLTAQDATLCESTIVPVETVAACHRTCVKAKRAKGVSPGAAPAPNWRSTLPPSREPAQH
jgi:hypothetical protein